MNNLELMMPITDKMLTENLIDEKTREIEKLKAELAARPKIMTEAEWFNSIGQCQNIIETFDEMVRLGYVKKAAR